MEQKRDTMATQLRDEAIELLGKRNVMHGDKTLPEKKEPPPSIGAPIKIKTNFFNMRMAKAISVHQYEVLIELMMPSRGDQKEERVEEPTRPSKDRKSARAIDNLKKARAAFDAVVQSTPDTFGRRERLYYDGGKMLFALDPLMSAAEVFNVRVTRNGADPLSEIDDRALAIVVKVKRTGVSLTLADVVKAKQATTDDVAKLTPLIQFLEIATSEAALKSGDHAVYQNGEFYMLDPTKHGFQPNAFPSLEREGMYLAVGAKKSVHMIDSPDATRCTPALVIDPKITPFYQIKLVSDLALSLTPGIEQHQNGDLDLLSKALVGVCVKPIHLPGYRWPIEIKSICAESSRTQTFDYDGEVITVFEYHQRKHGRTLEHPDLPLLEAVGRNDQVIFLPMELYEICDEQRVRLPQMIHDVQQTVLRATTRLPSVMLSTINRTANALRLDESPHLREAHVNVEKELIEVEGQQLPAPTVVYEPGQPRAYDPIQGIWLSGRQYLKPVAIKTWALYALERPEATFTDEMLVKFGIVFMEQCRSKGMEIDDPTDYRIIKAANNANTSDIPELADVFETAAKAKCQFILLITHLPDTGVHGALKMYEQKHGIITQNVTAGKAKAAMGYGESQKRLTLENIVNKTNMKNGGLNYEIMDVDSEAPVGQKDLFIGIGMNHPAGGYRMSTKDSGVPSVVGYAANDGEKSCEFTGNYAYQVARRDEKLRIVEHIVVECLTRFIDNRDYHPERIIIYRNGVSEGQFPFIMEFEVPLLDAAIKKVSPSAKIVLLVANKLHNTRLLRASISPGATKASEQNLPPGTLVNSGITHPYITEFYLLGHLGRLGTAKFPRYSVLYNPANVPLAELYKLTYELAFGHQIIAGTTGLPTPVYLADEYAKRGRNIYNAHSTSSLHNGNGSQEGSDSSRSNEHLTHEYSYSRTMLAYDRARSMRTVRFNA